jgi:hypothetical protein
MSSMRRALIVGALFIALAGCESTAASAATTPGANRDRQANHDGRSGGDHDDNGGADHEQRAASDGGGCPHGHEGG